MVLGPFHILHALIFTHFKTSWLLHHPTNKKIFSGDYGIPKNVAFESKIDTDLYEFAKNKTYITSMNLSPDGKFFATFGADKKIRVFRFLMGKLYCVIGKNML